jgi:hypothetical protein
MSALSSRFLRVAVCVLGLALVSHQASAVELYQWVDTDGVVAIGPNPPPGVSAVPYAPGQPAATAAPTAPAPAASPPPAPSDRPSPYAPGPAQIDCAVYRNAQREAASDLVKAEREIARLEAKLEELDETDLMYARTECVIPDGVGPVSNCRAETFDRDREISRSEKALEHAKEALDDAERRARHAELPPRCQPASAD